MLILQTRAINLTLQYSYQNLGLFTCGNVFLRKSRFSLLPTVVKTLQPRWRAMAMAACPTPPVPACTSRLSPGFILPLTIRAQQLCRHNKLSMQKIINNPFFTAEFQKQLFSKHTSMTTILSKFFILSFNKICFNLYCYCFFLIIVVKLCLISSVTLKKPLSFYFFTLYTPP